MEGSTADAQAAGSGLPGSMVPWNQIPRFTPGETDVRTYSKKLQFLRELWPAEYLDQLAPRAAMAVEGVAFQKVSRLDPGRLKSKDGVKYLVEALGGEWGRLPSEEKFDLFEKALYMTSQKSDESNDSYLARHDAAFEELMSQKVQLEDVRAYVLLRQSVLGAEDRKKIILDCAGNLSYDLARKSIRLLGSKFFQDLQTQGKTQGRTKTYDVHHVDEEPIYYQEEEEMDEDVLMQQLLESGDDDAMFIQEFEEQILTACQESQDLAACFTSYQEARQRLRDKAKGRGFWPVTGSKGRGKGKKGKSPGGGARFGAQGNQSFGGRRRSLADRIANSTCRRCGQAGHWKRECPLSSTPTPGGLGKKPNEMESFTGILQTDEEVMVITEDIGLDAAVEVVDDLPQGAVAYLEDLGKIHGHVFHAECSDRVECCFLGTTQWSMNLTHKLLSCCRKHDMSCDARAAVSFEAHPLDLKNAGTTSAPAVSIFSAEEADDEAIIDTGASRAVIGAERLKKLVRSLPPQIGKRVMQVPSEGVVFKFGNAGKLTSNCAVMLPRAQKGWLRIEVVPGHTPFLISSAILKGLKGIIDVEGKCLGFRGCEETIPLFHVRKNLLGVKVTDLLNKTPHLSDAPSHTLCAPTEESFTNETRHENGTMSLKTDGTLGDKLNDSKHDNMKTPQVHAAVTHHMHDMSTQDGIQNMFPKENSVNDHQGMSRVNRKDSACNAALLSDQDRPARGIFSETASGRHGESPRAELSRPHADHAHGWKSDGLSHPRRSSAGLGEASGYQYSHGLGVSQSSIGQACFKELRGHLRTGPGLCQPDVEPQRGVLVGSKFSDVQSSSSSGQRGGQETWPTGESFDFTGPSDDTTADASAADVFDGLEHSASADQSGQAQGEGQAVRSRGMDPDTGGNIGSMRGEQGQEGPRQSNDQDGDPAQQGEDRADSDTDCHLAARAAEGDVGHRSVSTSGEQLIQMAEKLNNLTHQIEGGLSTLKKDPAYVFKSERVYKCRGKNLNMLGNSNLKKSMTKTTNGIDLLEVYCDTESQLTKQVNLLGGRAVRFTKQDGDLGTSSGQKKLWSWIYLLEPRNIWVAPECKLWGNFSRFNMGRSVKMLDQIMERREADIPHLMLCNQLYLHQVSQSRHYHHEQPQGSEMTAQPELSDMALGTLPATFDMCQVGKLRLPSASGFLRKRTTLNTTCRTLFLNLNTQTCRGDHDHQPIQGKFKHEGSWKTVSHYAQTYTSQFARRVARVLLAESRHRETPLVLEEMVLGLEDHERPEMAQEALQLQKRRRVSLKQPENSLYGKAPTWHDVFRQAGHSTPRVGNAFYKGEEGDAVFRMVQQLVPDMTVKLVVACRGTDRHRIQPAAANCEVFPWRKTVLVARNSGEIVDLGPPEKWSTLTRARQIRSTGAARISLSIFGIKDEDGVVVDPPSAAVSSDRDSAEGQSPVCVPNEDQVMAEPSNSNGENFAWVPRIIPKSGPGFLMLDKGEQVELRRLHNNLGHPDPDKMVRFLTERGAKPEIVAGAKDMSCDTCVETQNRPKLSQPSRIHENLDFNDVVGADGAYWTNAQGKTFHFMHFIDESTLYHLGAVCARKVEDQIRVFLQAWVQWAGPCTLLYLDPAGEYISDEWSAALQSEGIRVSMTAAESHWQNGRAEAHGRIIKNMLTRMEKDQSILTVEDFSRCLRQAFAAKNSLSRVNGFTPEQCLLGKSRRLPGSLTSDFDAASHSLAESSSPEGIRFRAALQRRESARRAFVQADNDSSFRRALLRQSRPGKVEYEKGDWVLYWRRTKGNNRIERGRWYGPAQVIVSEKPKVIWLSHLGRVIRASPEHIRPASLREYANLPRDENGEVRDEKPQGRGFIDLGSSGGMGPGTPENGNPEVEPHENMAAGIHIPEPPVSEFSYAPTTPLESQPDGEQFPSGVSEPMDEASEEPPQQVEETPDLNDGRFVPVPDSDDGLCVFGDDLEVCEDGCGVWELNLVDHDMETPVADLLCQNPQVFEDVFIATGDRKKRVEVDYRRLGPSDQKLFDVAKQKEVKAWLDHGTVKRLAKGTLHPEQVMRCRWLLTWKDPLPGNTERRAKARLIILGFEDPGIGVVPNDAPTLSQTAVASESCQLPMGSD